MLPQRRKSAEEIAKLREEMGIPGAVPPAVAAETQTEGPTAAAALAPAPPPSIFEPPAEGELPPSPAPKPVKSLRRSERQPLERKAPVERRAPVATSAAAAGSAPAAAAAIPQRRHSDDEIQHLRMQTLATPEAAISYIHHLEAPKLWLIAGYAGSVLGFIAGRWGRILPDKPTPDFTFEWMASLSRLSFFPAACLVLMVLLSALSLAVAAGIWWKKPRSRHHSGFIAMITVLLVTFGTIIYYLPTTHGP